MFSNKEFELFDGHLKGKSLMTIDFLVHLMNDMDNAHSRINDIGITTVGQDGRIGEGEIIGINDGCYGVLPGNSLNPLIYRGENKEYADFVPSISRGEYITGSCNGCDEIIKKMMFLDWFRTTPYYKCCKNIKMNGHNMYFDFEAIAQHYGFPTSYIDITRDINVALFFAYTYYENGMYHPVKDFERYKPCLYIGNLKEIYDKNHEFLKLISYQAVVRAYRQKAMALDLSDCDSIKDLFIKVELPKVPEFAMGIFEHFASGELLMPTGRINDYQDIVAKYADKIKAIKTISIEYIERYCSIYQKDFGDIKHILESQGYEITTFLEKVEIPKEELEFMFTDIERGIKPFLRRLSFRPIATMS